MHTTKNKTFPLINLIRLLIKVGIILAITVTSFWAQKQPVNAAINSEGSGSFFDVKNNYSALEDLVSQSSQSAESLPFASTQIWKIFIPLVVKQETYLIGGTSTSVPPTPTATRTPTPTQTPTSTMVPGGLAKYSPANNATGLPTSLTLVWGGASDVSYYLYCYDTINNNSCDRFWTATYSTSAAISDLVPGQTYYWEVIAIKSSGATYLDNGTWWSFSLTGGSPTVTAVPSLTATPVVSPTATLIPTATQTVLTPPTSPTPTPTSTKTSVPPTPTSTKTSVPPTPTPTSTSVSPTPTATSVPPTPTSTKTSMPPTPTPTVMPSPTQGPGGNTYYVATNGNDANPGSQSQPWKTIKKATNTLVAGDTALVLSGTYNEQVNITASGITFQAQGKVITKNVYISGNSNTFRGFTITDPTSDWGIRTSGDHNLVENNEIYGTKQDGIWFFGSYNTFRGNYIHDILYSDSAPQTHTDCFQTWSWDWDVTNVLFENNICINNEVVNTSNEFSYIGRDITRLKPNGTTAAVRDITFRNNVLVIYTPIWAGFGFGPVTNITIENNTIVNMGLNGQNNVVTDITGMTNVSIINNLLINWGGTNTYQRYIVADGGTNISIHNNAIYNYNGVPPYGTAYPGDLWMVDPKIVSLSGLDFHLQSNSPLIDAGYNLGNLVPNDFDGVTRPQGAGYDIGAYEYTAP